MTIINPQTYMDGIWDWSILKGCFGQTKIEPTDIDGFVERNNMFLVLETKNIGVPIKEGQRKTFTALSNTGLFTIIILWGEKNHPAQIEVLYPSPLVSIPKTRGNLNDFRKIVAHWFSCVNNNIPLSFYIPPNLFKNLLIENPLINKLPAVILQCLSQANVNIKNDIIIFSNFKTPVHQNSTKQYIPTIQTACQTIFGSKVRVVI